MARSLLPLLFVSVSLTGCFGSHGRGRHDPPDSGPGMPPGADAGVDTGIPAWGTCNCCGTTVAVGPGESCLSGVCDPYCPAPPPPRCPLSPITLACGFEPIVAGTPTTLPVQMGNGEGCFCGETIECQVADLGAGRISLETGMCTDGPLCDACLPFIYGACELPALAEGRYQVDVNGAPGFTLDVVDGGRTERPALPPLTVMCLTAVTRSDDCGPAWPAQPAAPTRVCHARATDGRVPVPIQVTDGCTGCGTFGGPCAVEVSGGTIYVRPGEMYTSCDLLCDDICRPRTDVCWTPPLDPGHYAIIIESMPALTSSIDIFEPGLFPGPEEETCLEAFTDR